MDYKKKYLKYKAKYLNIKKQIKGGAPSGAWAENQRGTNRGPGMSGVAADAVSYTAKETAKKIGQAGNSVVEFGGKGLHDVYYSIPCLKLPAFLSTDDCSSNEKIKATERKRAKIWK